jgi:hypothetical protein
MFPFFQPGPWSTLKAPYPVERTLLTSGVVEAAMRSSAGDQKGLGTPHLSARYQPPRASTFWNE